LVDVLVMEGVLVLVGVLVGVGVMVGVNVMLAVGLGTVGVIDGVISAEINVHVGALVRVGESSLVGKGVQVTDGVMLAVWLTGTVLTEV
jgi:hypothetical protein